MPQSNEPTGPAGSNPAGEGAPSPGPAPTQPLPPAPGMAPPAAAAGPGAAGPGGAVPPPNQPPPNQPPPNQPPPNQPPPAGGPGGPPRKPGLWRQATSTTGGLIAVIVACCLAALLLVGLIGATVAAATHIVAAHRNQDVVVRMRGNDAIPPGLRKQLPVVPRGDGQGAGPKAKQPGPLLRGLGGLGGLGLNSVQHGEFTVQGADGKASVMTVQRGTVTAASSTSVTVKSADNFSATYAIDSTTLGPGKTLASGDNVVVLAQKSGAKAVLIRVVSGG